MPTRYRRPVGATAESSSLAGTRTVAGHHPMGVSTGVFARSRDVWPALVAEACRCLNLRGRAVGAVGRRASWADRVPATHDRGFRFGTQASTRPSRTVDEATVIAQLTELPLWVRTIVTHPDAIAEFGGLPSPRNPSRAGEHG